MKRLIMVMLALTLFVPAFAATEEKAAGPKEFLVYLVKKSKDNHFIPSGWMGDYGDIK